MMAREVPFGLAKVAAVGAQMSRANVSANVSGKDVGAPGNVLAFRPRARRRIEVISVSRDDALDWWAALLRRRVGRAEAIAQRFDVTVQTARNWLTGFSRPHVDVVLQAAIWWPDDFAALADACAADLAAGVA